MAPWYKSVTALYEDLDIDCGRGTNVREKLVRRKLFCIFIYIHICGTVVRVFSQRKKSSAYSFLPSLQNYGSTVSTIINAAVVANLIVNVDGGGGISITVTDITIKQRLL
ncbi:Hypothetical predicted protein [Octopus vulgaris]|uniref:Uncharacterized protein n=1 Tax=Octopus vulgaris TaxID=6645 RepID=A0AA36APD3_OCTVU|nr:Hypothetical predicted protein [Octopus vulgaris]